ncbi:MAG: formyltetrahydrofolate deformylase [Verrucomicrobiota bacterium JB022]|nr:formyltetrahydrofolate deformylase [Verrucomicrobiota bacterium JB022]
MSQASPTLTALLFGPDQKGLVAKTSGWIFACEANILHADQHTDLEAGIFFQRIVWQPRPETDVDRHAEAFRGFMQELGMEVELARSDRLPKVGVLVSKIPHCFHDFMLRWKSGEFACEVPLVISNHTELADDAAYYGVPFHHLPVTAANKAEVEQRQIELFREAGVDLVIMARYMQVLSSTFLENVGCPVINIHHSFLPAFAGAKPYHQAFARGVKLIGATAHYATAVLDDGPIIQQDVARVNHRHSVNDLVRKGRDLEKVVFAQAIRWHLEHRVLAYGNKTVVFD